MKKMSRRKPLATLPMKAAAHAVARSLPAVGATRLCDRTGPARFGPHGGEEAPDLHRKYTASIFADEKIAHQ